MTKYDMSAAEYIFDNYGREKLFAMTDEDLKQLVYQECDELSWANEELDFGTFGEHYENDINYDNVYNYILKERAKYNEKN